jgi:two-component system, NtrC family, sensor kinase
MFKRNIKSFIKMKAHQIILVGFIALPFQIVFANNINLADSLVKIYNRGIYHDTLELQLIRDIAANHTQVDSILFYSNILIDKSMNTSNYLWLHRGLLNQGHAYRKKGDLDRAIESYFKSAEVAKQINYSKGVAGSFSAIGTVYRVEKNYKTALEYYNLALLKFRETHDSVNLAKSLMNTGELYRTTSIMDTALIYFDESGKIFERLNFKIGTAYNLGNIGLVYAQQGRHNLAEENINKAIAVLKKLGDFYPIAVYDTYMADIYKDKGDIPRALVYAKHSLAIAIDNGLKEQIRDASLKLSELYQFNKDYKSAYQYQSQYLAYRDSINNEETIRKIADLRTEYEVSQKQIEIDLLESKRLMQNIIFISMTAAILSLSFLAFVYYRNNKRKQITNLLLTERKEEIETQRDQLEAMNKTQEKFLSIISHDLLGPVNSFKAFSLLIKLCIDQKDTRDLEEIYVQFDKSVNGLSSLLANLLDWSVTQQGTIPYKPEKVDLTVITDELINLFVNMATNKEIDLKSLITSSIQMWVDINCVRTILRNLVSNAIKFTTDGGTITISAEIGEEMVAIKIQDTGIGIPKEKLSTILTTNNYNRSWGTKGEKGLGLGLQLVKEFTEMNKGTISIDSKEGTGTWIVVSLPLWQSHLEEINAEVNIINKNVWST